MADAEAAPASPAAPAEAAPAAAADPRLEALQPIGPSSAEVYAVVPALRAALQDMVPAGSKLWGAELLNPDDKAGATVLGKCVPASSHLGGHCPRSKAGRPSGPPPRAPGAHTLTAAPSGFFARET